MHMELVPFYTRKLKQCEMKQSVILRYYIELQFSPPISNVKLKTHVHNDAKITKDSAYLKSSSYELRDRMLFLICLLNVLNSVQLMFYREASVV